MNFVDRLVVLLSVASFMVSATEVHKCRNSTGVFPDTVVIADCSQEPCKVALKSTAVMNLTFIAPQDLQNIRPKVIAYIEDHPINYPISGDACDHIANTECPIAQGEEVEYDFSMYVAAIFPKITLELEFSIIDLDDNKKDVVCFGVNLQIV